MKAVLPNHFIDCFTEPLLLLHGDGRIAAANAQARVLLALSETTLDQTPLTEFSSDPPAELAQRVRDCSTELRPFNVRLRPPGGGESVACLGQAVAGDQSEVQVLLRCTSTDQDRSQPSYREAELLQIEVARRHQTEVELNATKAQAQAVLDTAVDAIVTIDSNGLVLSFNGAAERLFGYRPDEILGANIAQLMPEPHSSQHDAYIRRYLSTGEKHIIGIRREVEGQRQDGSTFPMELVVSEVLVDGGRYFIGLAHDISERRQTEEQLRQREEQLSLTFDNAPLGIITSDAERQLLTANPAFCTMLGYSVDELQQWSRLDRLLHPDDCSRAESLAEELWHGHREGYAVGLRYRRKDGADVYADEHAALVHDSVGRPLMAVALVQDRSAQRRAEQEAHQHRERLAHVSRFSTLGEMATGIAHEINQPLTAIATYARACHRLISSGQSVPADLLVTLEKISNQAQRAGEVIRRLRDFVRKRDSRREVYDLNALVHDAIVLAETDSRAYHFVIQTRLTEQPLLVNVDPIQVQQVLLNLIRNAMEAMAGVAEHSESIVVTVASAADRQHAAHVSISDRGAGIESQYTEQLFDPFFTTKSDGMGMGLSISRSIVTAHGGRLWFEPNDGAGVTVHFTLPLVGDGQQSSDDDD